MRTYIKNPSRDQTGLREKRRTETSNEWDIGLNLEKEDVATHIAVLIAYCKAQCEKPDTPIVYLLIGGVEYTEQTRKKDNTTKDNYHVHICLVTNKKINKQEALSCVRIMKMGPKEYARVRQNKNNKHQTYYGWRIHHIKPDTKIDVNKRLLFEFGTLPEDVWDNAKITNCNGVVRRYGSVQDQNEWSTYRSTIRQGMTDSQRKEKEQFQKMERAKMLYEQQMMLMEDVWEQRRQLEATNKAEREIEALMDDHDKRRKQARNKYFQYKNANRNRKRKRGI